MILPYYPVAMILDSTCILHWTLYYTYNASMPYLQHPCYFHYFSLCMVYLLPFSLCYRDLWQGYILVRLPTSVFLFVILFNGHTLLHDTWTRVFTCLPCHGHTQRHSCSATGWAAPFTPAAQHSLCRLGAPVRTYPPWCPTPLTPGILVQQPLYHATCLLLYCLNLPFMPTTF